MPLSKIVIHAVASSSGVICLYFSSYQQVRRLGSLQTSRVSLDVDGLGANAVSTPELGMIFSNS